MIAMKDVYSGEGFVNFSPFKKQILIGRDSNSMALYGNNANDMVNNNLVNFVCINFLYGGAKIRKS